MELRTLWLAIMILADLAIVYTMFAEIMGMVQVYSCNKRQYHRSRKVVTDLGRKTIYKKHSERVTIGRIAELVSMLGILAVICLVLMLV